ncbi:hypothetical protein BC827DRAFT_1288527 [Russula dissimulans]|nr:hypothetical protein BC827DRAFT_1288527 [Russula dissimulans]
MASNTTAIGAVEELRRVHMAYAISNWEKAFYYKNPFPVPKGRYPYVPIKTVYGVFNTALNAVWHTVAPKICGILKSRGVRYSALKTARFLTRGEDEDDRLGPIVIWIATHPGTTTAEKAHGVSPDILNLLEVNGVKGAVVEWYEGAWEKLSGPPLLRVTTDADPTHYFRRFLTTALGMPIAAKEREDDGAQGSVAITAVFLRRTWQLLTPKTLALGLPHLFMFSWNNIIFFHENINKRGEPSANVFAVSNCHVLRKNTAVTYEFKGPGAPPQYVRLSGSRRFQRAITEIRAWIGGSGTEADVLAREIVDLVLKLESEEDPDAMEDARKAVVLKRTKLANVKEEIVALEAFYWELNARWSDIERRNIGHVDWAPEISVDVEGDCYTKDIGTFGVYEARFKPHFKGNVVDLGVKYSPWTLTDKFYPDSNTRTVFQFPLNRQLRISGCVTPELLANPDCFDSSGEPCLIVMKDGNATDLTVGRYAGLEAYLCDELGVESRELAVYNYDKESGSFSAKGDSGSLIFDGMGKMVGILHSGMPKGISSHVTFATPAWWVLEQLKHHYPHADFYRKVF